MRCGNRKHKKKLLKKRIRNLKTGTEYIDEERGSGLHFLVL
jgi:hypothetical protein